jgi:hypothetical protein
MRTLTHTAKKYQSELKALPLTMELSTPAVVHKARIA